MIKFVANIFRALSMIGGHFDAASRTRRTSIRASLDRNHRYGCRCFYASVLPDHKNGRPYVTVIVRQTLCVGQMKEKEKDDDIAHPGMVSKPEKTPNFGSIQ
jgi:hypothetical protein